jgi:cyclic beta-1,2-glucan synthetase
VAVDSPIKIVRLRLENVSDRDRRITVTYYAEWVLGTTKDITQQYIIPEFDPAGHILLFHNPYSIEFGGQFAFITANKDFHGLTTDRAEFLGRLGNYQRPAALERIGLSGTCRQGRSLWGGAVTLICIPVEPKKCFSSSEQVITASPRWNSPACIVILWTSSPLGRR